MRDTSGCGGGGTSLQPNRKKMHAGLDQPLNAGFFVAVIQLDLERELESALRVDKAFFAKRNVAVSPGS